MADNQYWRGTTKAVIRQRDFSSDLINRMYTQRIATTTSFCNQAFSFFFRARQAIAICPAGEQKERMTSDLDAAAKQGFWGSLANLEDVFDYISTRRSTSDHWWEDDDTSQYVGGSDKFFSGTVIAPTGIVNFAEAIDEAWSEIETVFQEFTTLQDTLEASVGIVGGSGGQTELEIIQNSVEEVKSWTEDAGRILWVINATDTLVDELQPVGEAVQNAVGRVGSFAGSVGDLLGALNNVAAMEAEGIDHDMAVGLGVFQTICTQIPIIGNVFVEAIKVVPQLARKYRGLFTRQEMRIQEILGSANIRGIQPRGTQNISAGPSPTGAANGRNIGRLPGPT